jgi:short subunit dehydrogenase-like uncharacterized protein
MKLEEALPDGEELVSVDCLDEMVGAISGGTAATMMLSVGGQGMPAPKYNFNPLCMLSNGTKSDCTCTFEPSFLVRKSVPINGRFASTYSYFFVMALVNADVIKRSTALRQTSKNVIYRESAAAPDFKTAFCMHFGFVAFMTALLNPITSTLLQKYLPEPGQGPPRSVMENQHFLALTAQGIGSKGTKVQSVMYFPRDAGYMDTARMVAETGLVLGMDAAMLSREGGFFTSSTGGMGNVLLGRLCKTGTKFALSITQ